MKISERKNETVIRLQSGESALYYGTYNGKQAVGAITATSGEDISIIDAAIRGMAFLLSTDREFAAEMAEVYRTHVSGGERVLANDN